MRGLWESEWSVTKKGGAAEKNPGEEGLE